MDKDHRTPTKLMGEVVRHGRGMRWDGESVAIGGSLIPDEARGTLLRQQPTTFSKVLKTAPAVRDR